MTVAIANIAIANDTWGDLITRVNQMADAFTDQVVTVGGSNSVGNSVITGSQQVDTLHVDTISGGSIGMGGLLTINTNVAISSALTTINSNTVFSGTNNHFNSITSIGIGGSNATHQVLAANNTTNKLYFTQFVDTIAAMEDVNVAGVANASFLRYSSVSGNWEDILINDVLNMILDIDGAGSSLDADTVDGFNTNTSSQASTIVVRNSNHTIAVNSVTFGISQTTRSTDNVFFSSTTGHVYRNTAEGMRSSLGVYSTSEVDALIANSAFVVLDSSGGQLYP